MGFGTPEGIANAIPSGSFRFGVSTPLLFSGLSYFRVVLLMMLFGRANSLWHTTSWFAGWLRYSERFPPPSLLWRCWPFLQQS